MADLSSDIASQAAEPASVSVDGQTVSSRPVADQVAADVYAGGGKTAAGKRRRGLMFSQIVTPGASGLTYPNDFDRPGGC